MKDSLKFIKHNLKYIIPVIILIIVGIVCVLKINVYNPNKQITTDNFKAVDYKNHSGSLTIDGQTDGFKYEWFYSQNMLTDCQDTDLNLIFTSEYDELISKNFNPDYSCTYYFPKELNLNGYPTLTVYIPENNLIDINLYEFNPQDETFKQVKVACNKNIDNYSITYAVKDVDCIYVVTANIENQTDITTQDTQITTQLTTTLETSNITMETTSNTTTQSETSVTTSDTSQENNSDNVISNEDIQPDRELSDGSQITQDDYLTDPIPEGRPLPVEPNEITVEYQDYYTCYLTIRCDTILNNMENLTSGKESYVPEDGIIYDYQEVIFYEGESVYDVLSRETEKNGIQLESTFTPMYNSAYIEGINNLYEFDCGSLSGWVYSVNDWFPNYGCSRYSLSQGDNIIFYYTCTLGQDVGCVLEEVS